MSVGGVSSKKPKKGPSSKRKPPTQEEVAQEEGGVCESVNKKTKSSYNQGARCFVCTKLVGTNDAARTVYRCPTCNVFLCIKPHGSKRYSCFQRFHSQGVKNLQNLAKVNTVTQPRKSPRGSVPLRTSPRRPTNRGTR